MERTPLRIPARRNHIAQTGNAAILQNYRPRGNHGLRIKRPRRHHRRRRGGRGRDQQPSVRRAGGPSIALPGVAFSPAANGRCGPPRFGPRSGPVREGVRHFCTCRHDAEHGERGEEVANAAAVHGLAPFGFCLSPMYVGARASCGQYRFVRVPKRNPNGQDTEGRVALPWRNLRR